MTTDTGFLVPPEFAHLIAAAAEAAEAAEAAKPKLSEMPTAERLKHHRKKLDEVALFEGVEGVNEYKEEHPEAAAIKVRMDVRAYLPKPPGYNAYLAEVAGNWLTMRVAVSSTNRDDVERLNARFGRNFNPANHFNELLTPTRLKKIQKAFAEHGAPLDIDKANTMSKVRQAAMDFWTRTNVDKPLGKAGVISGRTLVINGHRFIIEKNGERDCIRLPNRFKRRRLYLDELEWLADLLVEGLDDPLLSTTSSIRELAYSGQTGENDPQSDPEISDLAYGNEMPALRQRIAALKVTQQPQSTALQDDVDPLAL